MSANDPPSPCNRRCTLDPDTDICLGCFRTLAEITAWSAYTTTQRQVVLGQLPQRRAEHEQKYKR